MISIEDTVNCHSLETLNKLADEFGFKFLWQKLTKKYVYTYDRLPNGFLDIYYGSDFDLKCPCAWAFRSRIWPVFSFQQARTDTMFNGYDPRLEAQKVWEKFGIIDGLVVLSGSPGLDSFAVFTFDHMISDPKQMSLPFIALTHKLDNWLCDDDSLKAIKREFSELSPKEKDAMTLQINAPHLSLKEQAKSLGVSEATLKGRHERIAKKFGVKRFSGAVLLAERTGFY